MFEIIIRPRSSGKTTALIERADNYNGYIVCRSMQEAQRISKMAAKQGHKIHYPITYEEFLKGEYYPPGVKRLHIDNAEELLRWIFCYVSKCPVATITMERDFISEWEKQWAKLQELEKTKIDEEMI